jgi:hypothetical protein
MMVARASGSLAEGRRGRQGRGRASYRAMHETHRQPRCVGEEEGGKQRSGGATRGNRTRKGAGVRPPHHHYHVHCACCSHVDALHAGCCRLERAGRCCVVWAGKGGEGDRMMMRRRRTTDGKAWLTGQSKANKSKHHQGMTVQWDRHKDRVHTRLAGHREAGRQGREFKNRRRAFHREHASSPKGNGKRCRLKRAQTRIKRLVESTNLHIFVN